ncbi:winged helix-turn-helix domain-containing protein [Ancylobacter lacus]|nr:winged helix-turn-helix domain-containing protein [Ancylobacter lacus]
MPHLSIRLDLDPNGRVGPGKIELLECIARTGSISAGGRAMAMSYRRAWELVDSLGQLFGQPVVLSQTGGRHGGGARLTPFGEELVFRYRQIERAAEEAAAVHLRALQDAVKGPPAGRPTAADAGHLHETSPPPAAPAPDEGHRSPDAPHGDTPARRRLPRLNGAVVE